MAQVRGADLVQLPAPLSDLEYASLADVLEQRPSVELRAYDSHIGKFSDVAFLRFFPFLRRLSLDVWSVTDLSGLDAIDDLLTFSLGATKKAFSLRLLKRFKSLRGLLLERQHKDFEVVSELSQLQGLGLRSMTLPNLAILSAFPELRHFELKLGGTRDLTGLAVAKRLRYIELWLIRGLTDVNVLGEVTSLEALFLQALKHVTELPSFVRLKSLRHVYLEQMKGLCDLSAVAQAPQLQDLTIVDMPHLSAAAFNAIAQHPTLEYFSAGLGTTRLNIEAAAIMNRPKPPKPVWPQYSVRYAALEGSADSTL